jgi:antitoxin Phd
MSRLSRYNGKVMSWQLQEAKNKFSQVVRDARESGPQVISVHGKDAVVLLSIEEYRRLENVAQGGFLEFMQSSPWSDIELDIERVDDVGREVEL